MKKFKNNRSGVIYTVINEKLVEQYEKRPELYTEVGSEPSLKALKTKADELGVEYTKKTTKAELLELISAKEEAE